MKSLAGIGKTDRERMAAIIRRTKGTISVEEAAESRSQVFRFDSLVINGDRAIVIFEDGVTLNEATLVRRADKWYIAGVERLLVTGP